jgi:hypothetical protein
MLDKRPVAILLEGCSQLFLGIHYNGAVPGHWFADRLARDEQKTQRPFFRGYAYGIAIIEGNQGFSFAQALAVKVEIVLADHLMGKDTSRYSGSITTSCTGPFDSRLTLPHFSDFPYVGHRLLLNHSAWRAEKRQHLHVQNWQFQ